MEDSGKSRSSIFHRDLRFSFRQYSHNALRTM